MCGVFSAKLFCKMSHLFRWFLLVLRFSARNSKIKKNSDDLHWNVWTNINPWNNAWNAWNNIFKKRIPNMRYRITYILLFFGGGMDYPAQTTSYQGPCIIISSSMKCKLFEKLTFHFIKSLSFFFFHQPCFYPTIIFSRN